MSTDKRTTEMYAWPLPPSREPSYDWRALYPAPAMNAPLDRFGDNPEVLAAFPSTNEIKRRHELARDGMMAALAIEAARAEAIAVRPALFEVELAALALQKELVLV